MKQDFRNVPGESCFINAICPVVLETGFPIQPDAMLNQEPRIKSLLGLENCVRLDQICGLPTHPDRLWLSDSFVTTTLTRPRKCREYLCLCQGIISREAHSKIFSNGGQDSQHTAVILFLFYDYLFLPCAFYKLYMFLDCFIQAANIRE